MKKYQLIIFDFDGTIADTQEAISYSIIHTFRLFGYSMAEDVDLFSVIRQGKKMEETFLDIDASLAELSPEAIQEMVLLYRKIYIEKALAKAVLYEGIKDAIIHFYSQNIPLAIVSNKGQLAIEKTLRHFELDQYMQLVIGDRLGAPKKPDPDLFYQQIQPVFPDISPADILMIGDNSTDIGFANNVGMDSCWVTYGHGVELAAHLTPTFVVGSAGELRG